MRFITPVVALIMLLTVVFAPFANAQDATSKVSSRNGYWMPNHDTLRIFLIFAEATGDPDDTKQYGPNDLWQRGQMPRNADDYFDWQFTGPDNINSRITRFFYQASFGDFILLGDYYPKLIQVPRDGLKRFGDEAVMQALDAQTGSDITTAHGLHFNGGDFDRWTTPKGYGQPKEARSDGYVDFLMIVWRVNSTVSKTNNGGSVNVNKWEYPFKQMKGFMDRSRFVSKYSTGSRILQHEFSHSLYGGNNFHTGGRGAGNSTFLSAMGGYSNLSSYGSFSGTFNGWDRHRMGWKPNGNKYYISALCEHGHAEVSTDLTYGEVPSGCGNGEDGFDVILRDFVSTGDDIRIELPYLRLDNEKIRRQYLWLENHQILPGNEDHNPKSSPGIYAYVQVDREDTASFRGTGNYTAPLNAYGHYDFEPDLAQKAWHLPSGRSNPFTGYHFSMIPAYNITEPNIGRVRGDTVFVKDAIYRNEMFYVEHVFIGARELPAEDFNFKTHPALGTVWDAFAPGRKIGLGTNPAPEPVLTWEMRYNNTMPPYDTPRSDDNRTIWLNGLSIQIGNRRADGSLPLHIRYDDFDVDGNLRWCGPMELVEELHLTPSTKLLIDLGLSPVRPVDPITFKGEKVFADPSFLHLRPGSLLQLDEKAEIELKNHSEIRASGGGTLNMGPDSKIVLRSGTHLSLEGCSLIMQHAACIEVHSGAVLQLDSAVFIQAMADAVIRIKKGGELKLAKPADEYGGKNLFRMPGDKKRKKMIKREK